MRAEESGAASGYVGEAACRACHVLEATHWDATVHAQVFHQRPRTTLQTRSCEACHGPGAAHLESPEDPAGIVAFTRESGAPVERQNEMCLACHAGGSRIFWPGSIHQTQDLGCSDCHNPMTNTSSRALLRAGDVSRTCFACHPQQRIEFRKRSHMPLLEGEISCTDCHAPHGSNTDPLLRGDSVNQLCYTCHAEKRGPFLFEHAPVRDSCLHCHRPHGSNHERLLVRSPPFLCQACHAQIGAQQHVNDLLTRGSLALGPQPDERLINRGCTNCHAQIHGSNHPSGVRFHR